MNYINKTTDELIEIFEENLLETNRGFNFYIDWDNIAGLDDYIIEFHSMDALINCHENFDNMFLNLLQKVPTVIKTFPFLFALAKAERDKMISGKTDLKVIGSEIDSEDVQEFSFKYTSDMNGLTIEQRYRYLDFFKHMGLKNLFQNIIEKSVLDYVVGVLVGLDSNGRKNRGGKAFELACEPMIRQICDRFDVKLITQKKFKILEKYGFNINDDIANRKADFILLKNNKCMNIEVNFFNGGGSKPEEIIDSYINRQSDLKKDNIDFALITDGNCWRVATNQLRKGFRYLKYLMNYKMSKNSVLEEIICEIFDE